MRNKIATLLAALSIVAATAVWPEDRATLYWLMYEQGSAAMARKEFGKALRLFKDAIAGSGIFPEAEMSVGDVYLEEGEIDLARQQYEKAYNQRNAFYIPDSQYDVLYRLAHLYEIQGLYRLMEDSLGLIVADDKRFMETGSLQLKTQVEKNYFDNGIDRTLALYAFSTPFAAAAHAKLGWFYYRTGRFSQSVPHLLYAVVDQASRIETYLRERDVDYQFSTLQGLLETVEGNPEISSLAAEAGLYQDLYYLAGSTYAIGSPQKAHSLWRLISAFASAGKYQGLSARQLKSPWVEPLLVTSPTRSSG